MTEDRTPIASLLDLSGRSAIVTGAGVGIGFGIASRLAEAGASVTVADVSRERAEEGAKAIANEGWSAQPFAADVSKHEDVEAMVASAVDAFGSVDILVNNAGIYPTSLLMEMDDALFDKVLEVNLRGVYLCTRAVAARMIDQGRGGRIVQPGTLPLSQTRPGEVEVRLLPAHVPVTPSGAATDGRMIRRGFPPDSPIAAARLPKASRRRPQMISLVVHESMFGNTKEIARAIAGGLGPDTRVISIDQLTGDHLAGVDLLVIGGPTHAWSMSRPNTREGARDQGAPASIEFGVRERVPALGRRNIFAAAFDTRLNKPRFITGAASKAIGRMLQRHAYRLIIRPESFLVEGTKGPLAPGEIERAKAWGQTLRARVEASDAAA